MYSACSAVADTNSQVSDDFTFQFVMNPLELLRRRLDVAQGKRRTGRNLVESKVFPDDKLTSDVSLILI